MSHVPGTFKQRVEKPYRDRSQESLVAEKILLYAGALYAERWVVGKCTVMFAREPNRDGFIWHLSIAHPTREPRWDEIKTAVYGIPSVRALTEEGLAWAQILGRVGKGEWVNVHDNCFHLYAIDDPLSDWEKA